MPVGTVVHFVEPWGLDCYTDCDQGLLKDIHFLDAKSMSFAEV